MNLLKTRINKNSKSVANSVKRGVCASLINNAIFLNSSVNSNTLTIKILGIKLAKI